MRQINSKRYNPEAARLIGYGSGSALYLKRTGECFIVAQNDKIMPISLRDAQDFARQHGLFDVLTEAITYQADSKTQISAYLTHSARSELKRLSGYWHMSISETIERIIHQTYDSMQGQSINLAQLPHISNND